MELIDCSIVSHNLKFAILNWIENWPKNYKCFKELIFRLDKYSCWHICFLILMIESEKFFFCIDGFSQQRINNLYLSWLQSHNRVASRVSSLTPSIKYVKCGIKLDYEYIYFRDSFCFNYLIQIKKLYTPKLCYLLLTFWPWNQKNVVDIRRELMTLKHITKELLLQNHKDFQQTLTIVHLPMHLPLTNFFPKRNNGSRDGFLRMQIVFNIL